MSSRMHFFSGLVSKPESTAGVSTSPAINQPPGVSYEVWKSVRRLVKAVNALEGTPIDFRTAIELAEANKAVTEFFFYNWEPTGASCKTT